MIPPIPPHIWEKNQKEHRELKKELEAKSTLYLEGMVDTYSRMKPFVSPKNLDRKRMGKLILVQRELSKLTKEELQKESEEVNSIKDLFQFFADAMGYNSAYARREIALDLLGREGKPYFVVR